MVKSVIVDLVITFQDWAFDLNAVYIFAVSGHIMFTLCAIAIILLPGITIVSARVMSQGWKQMDYKTHLHNVVMVFAYPLALLYTGVGIIKGTSAMPLKYFKHMKTYDGVLESSFMFFMQLTVICNSTPIGQNSVLTLLGIPDGKFYLMLVGLFGSFGSFIYNMSEYHLLSDNVPKDLRRQVKLMPYYSIHFLFRSFTYSMFFVYWRYYACVTVFMVMAFNMWLTKRTYETDPGTQRQPHIHFCTIVGGFCSFLSPCLALFFNQTTSTRNLNYFYKRNILGTNLFFGCIFAALVVHINTTVSDAETNYVRRNVVFSCKENNTMKPWTQFEFSRPAGRNHDIIFENFHTTPFLGTEDSWWSRVLDEPKYKPEKERTPEQNKTHYALDHFLVSQPCGAKEKESDRFNKIIIPLVAVSWCISTALAFHKLQMAPRGGEGYGIYG